MRWKIWSVLERQPNNIIWNIQVEYMLCTDDENDENHFDSVQWIAVQIIWIGSVYTLYGHCIYLFCSSMCYGLTTRAPSGVCGWSVRHDWIYCTFAINGNKWVRVGQLNAARFGWDGGNLIEGDRHICMWIVTAASIVHTAYSATIDWHLVNVIELKCVMWIV